VRQMPEPLLLELRKLAQRMLVRLILGLKMLVRQMPELRKLAQRMPEPQLLELRKLLRQMLVEQMPARQLTALPLLEH